MPPVHPVLPCPAVRNCENITLQFTCLFLLKLILPLYLFQNPVASLISIFPGNTNFCGIEPGRSVFPCSPRRASVNSADIFGCPYAKRPRTIPARSLVYNGKTIPYLKNSSICFCASAMIVSSPAAFNSSTHLGTAVAGSEAPVNISNLYLSHTVFTLDTSF